MKISIFASGSGTNLQNILDRIDSKELQNVEVNSIVVDRDCKAIERGLEKDIPTFLFERGENLSKEIDEVLPSDTDYIVLAGFLSILSGKFCEKWHNKMINVHPSLLPKYGGAGMYGMNVHRAVIEAKEKESGATVHFVTEGIDQGEIILQESVKIEKSDSAEILQKKVQQLEYQILPEAIKLLVKKHK